MRYQLTTLFVLLAILTIAYRTGVSNEASAGFQPLTEAHLWLEVGQDDDGDGDGDPDPACPMVKSLSISVCQASGTTCAGYSQSDCPNQSWRSACLAQSSLEPGADGEAKVIKVEPCPKYNTGFCMWQGGACVCGTPQSFPPCGSKKRSTIC